MNPLHHKYEALVEEEDLLFKKINTAEICLTGIMDYVYRYGESGIKLIVEEFAMVVHQIEMNLRIELLHLRLEKARIAGELKKSETNKG